MNVLIGCQGWNYADWTTRAGGEPVFYPRGTKRSEMLEVYARAFKTVEVDSTFYAVPSRATIEGWSKKTPDDFKFSLKLPQVITHENALHQSSFEVLSEFCENVRVLGDKLGVVLIQLPPQFVAGGGNTEVLKLFLAELPGDIGFAIEFRERGWFDFAVFELLAKHTVALCLTEGHWISRAMIFNAAREKITDFAYVRFMGERDLTEFNRVQREQAANLELWHECLQTVAENARQTFVYFSNFYEGFAPASANKLKQLIGQQTVEPSALEKQPSLF